MPSLSRPPAASDLKARLLAEWRADVRHRPPGARLAWLESAAGLVLHGARQRKALVREIKALRRRLEQECCSGAWVDGAFYGREQHPPPGMVLARHPVRFGDGPPTCRFTPPIACAMEDEIDGLSFAEAACYSPADISASAVAIRRIGFLRGRELDPPTIIRGRRGRPARERCGKPKVTALLVSGKDRVVELAGGRGASVAELWDAVKDCATQMTCPRG